MKYSLNLENNENILQKILNNQNIFKICKMTNLAIKSQEMTKYTQNFQNIIETYAINKISSKPSK